MAAKLEIKVPLLSVNDTVLTVADIPMANGAQVRKGDLILIFESSKTTYEVHAEEDGYIRYECETGADYEVNEIVARLFDDPAEAGAGKTPSGQTGGVKQTTSIARPPIDAELHWEGETLFSRAALARMAEKGVDRS
jgi:pyruvate/2-oxoglutarate dehydrogenase complex dihydrolipoamide acyltransferase (E2) component